MLFIVYFQLGLLLVTHFNNLAPWLFKNLKINGSKWMSPQVKSLAHRSDPHYPTPIATFLQAVALLTCQYTLRQTIFSQSHSMVYQGPEELRELRMKDHLWRRSAPCWFRFWCHFSWLGLALCSLGCCWKWFRWGKEKDADTGRKDENKIDRLWWYQDWQISSSWKWNHLLVLLLLHCVFMTDLGCFPRDRSTPHPGPGIIRHEREPGNDPGLQALDCGEPLFYHLNVWRCSVGVFKKLKNQACPGSQTRFSINRLKNFTTEWCHIS